ncbi:glycoside hydrolase family 65 protein [Microbulbifer sp. OS29]|uniref:Glycoside hydrolase family 65 protein n=1 Tax=Microbulbifer okhotskensis TaxID=2926617 RepID=A0A9X2J6Y7_9GAMM|nr:glycosyl hydrolase family 65 protein [Microbulbifer okhotskensis]MCO1335954.1 glycoside hydrolase family 65 protein [Microbulbifer okhotskensis]
MKQQQIKHGIHPWSLVEKTLQPEDYCLNATLFSLGNGYIGLRGAFEEGYDPEPFTDGCYLNGVYASEPIGYGEAAYGYARNNQRMLTVPDGKTVHISLDGERFSLAEGELLHYERRLDMVAGISERKLTWRSPKGKTIELRVQRLVSLKEKHLFVLNLELTPINFDGEVRLQSCLDGDLAQAERSDDPRLASPIDQGDIQWLGNTADGTYLALPLSVKSSGFSICSAALHDCASDSEFTISNLRSEDCVSIEYRFNAQRNTPIRLTKYVAYFAEQNAEPIEAAELRSYLEFCATKGFAKHVKSQRLEMEKFWSESDIQVNGNDALQQGIRFNLYHLFQSLGRDGRTNIAAKGLSGDGYDGHYFWDTEIYVLPFFLYTQPQLARGLLEYRHSILDAARARAREMAIGKGALFPWRTIGGEECSAYYPAGTAQYHINADIAYAVRHYCRVTGDIDFLRSKGAEVVIEGARMWMEVGHFNPRRDNQFCINGVTGPDEYTALVDNNFYTNLMAQAHLQYAAEVFYWLKSFDPKACAALAEHIQLGVEEPLNWVRAAETMYLPYNDTQGIHPQDDSFLDKPQWNFADTPADQYPLLLHYHPLVIYRHQVCKQADVVLGLLLQSSEFSVEQKRRDFDFYEPLTTHDSTLSACIHSIIASEVGYPEKALNYFQQVARMDLDNYHNNTQHGIHTACMGGTWMCMVQGFAGMRLHGSELNFNPYIPDGMDGYRFRLQFRDRTIALEVDRKKTSYTLVKGEAITLHHGDQILLLGSKGQTEIIQMAQIEEVS